MSVPSDRARLGADYPGEDSDSEKCLVCPILSGSLITGGIGNDSEIPPLEYTLQAQRGSETARGYRCCELHRLVIGLERLENDPTEDIFTLIKHSSSPTCDGFVLCCDFGAVPDSLLLQS
jgi:hypothetical protein